MLGGHSIEELGYPAAVHSTSGTSGRSGVVAVNATGRNQSILRYPAITGWPKPAAWRLTRLISPATAHDAETWEKVVRKLGAGVMPLPVDPAQTPPRTTIAIVVISQLDRAAVDTPNPGRTEAFHGLNRAEFRNAVRDLLALDIDVAALLPADEATYGFNNMAGVQRMSPTLMERYRWPPRRITRVAIGTPGVAPKRGHVSGSTTISRIGSAWKGCRSARAEAQSFRTFFRGMANIPSVSNWQGRVQRHERRIFSHLNEARRICRSPLTASR